MVWIETKADNGVDADEADDCIYVKSDYKLLRIALDRILYIEGLKDYIKIHVEDEPKAILSLISMKAMEEKLPSSRFIRVHRSFIVQKSKIKVLDRGRIVFGKEYIPISDSYKQELQIYLNSHSVWKMWYLNDKSWYFVDILLQKRNNLFIFAA